MIDPIFKIDIDENRSYTLGKTTYSIDSLKDWFLIKKAFVNPMTNMLIRGMQLSELIEAMKNVDFFPKIDINRVACYRVYLIFEKYNILKNIKGDIDKKRNKLLEKIKEKEEKIELYRNKGLLKLMEQVGGLNNRICKLDGKLECVESKYNRNIELLLGCNKKVVKVI